MMYKNTGDLTWSYDTFTIDENGHLVDRVNVIDGRTLSHADTGTHMGMSDYFVTQGKFYCVKPHIDERMTAFEGTFDRQNIVHHNHNYGFSPRGAVHIPGRLDGIAADGSALVYGPGTEIRNPLS
jgi:hypothetical protein